MQDKANTNHTDAEKHLGGPMKQLEIVIENQNDIKNQLTSIETILKKRKKYGYINIIVSIFVIIFVISPILLMCVCKPCSYAYKWCVTSYATIVISLFICLTVIACKIIKSKANVAKKENDSEMNNALIDAIKNMNNNQH